MPKTKFSRGYKVLLVIIVVMAALAGGWRYIDRELTQPKPLPGASAAGISWDAQFDPAPVMGQFNTHGFLAPDANGTMHGDGGQSDTHAVAGPFGAGWSVRTRTSGNGMPHQCATFVHRRDGKVVAMCGGLSGFRIVLLDPATLELLASHDLPIRPSAFEAVVKRDMGIMMNDSSGGAYLFLDAADRVVLANSRWVLQRLAMREQSGHWHFTVDREWDLKPYVPHDCLNWNNLFPSSECDKVTSVLPDGSGYYWWTTRNGRLGTLDPRTGRVRVIRLGGTGSRVQREEIQNSFAVDSRAVYVISDHAQYAFAADANGTPQQLWRSPYDRGSARKIGSINQGSGTTPTLIGADLITFADNADGRINVVVLDRRQGQLICKVPVFAEGASSTDNSMIGWGRSIILENNAGYTSAHQQRDWRAVRGGMVRVDVRADRSGCDVVWTSPIKSPSVVSKLAAGSGIVWTYSFERDERRDETRWALVGLDFNTGRPIMRIPTGVGNAFDNNWSSISLAADGTLYLGVTQGLVQVRRNTR
ncbi:MAG: hypothetical protein RLZZ427_1095 [Pseudomonadota bacterium]|jgi:hypothetical protein